MDSAPSSPPLPPPPPPRRPLRERAGVRPRASLWRLTDISHADLARSRPRAGETKLRTQKKGGGESSGLAANRQLFSAACARGRTRAASAGAGRHRARDAGRGAHAGRDAAMGEEPPAPQDSQRIAELVALLGLDRPGTKLAPLPRPRHTRGSGACDHTGNIRAPRHGNVCVNLAEQPQVRCASRVLAERCGAPQHACACLLAFAPPH